MHLTYNLIMEREIENAIAAAHSDRRFLTAAELEQARSSSNTAIAAARKLGENAPALIEGAAGVAYAKFADYVSNPEGKEICDRVIQRSLRILTYCLVAGSTEPLDKHLLPGLDGMFYSFQFPPSCAAAVLDYLKKAPGLTEQEAIEANRYIDAGIAAISELERYLHKKPEPTGEVLTLAEIYQRYPDCWLLIADPELDEELNVIRGEVVAHSPNRDEVYADLSARKDRSIAIEYTGKIPEDLAVLL